MFTEGVWPETELEKAVNVTALFLEIRDILEEANIHGIYKTTTTARGNKPYLHPPHDEVGCRIMHSCLNLTWTEKLVGAPHYYDKFHFKPHADQWMNYQLWDILNAIRPLATLDAADSIE